MLAANPVNMLSVWCNIHRNSVQRMPQLVNELFIQVVTLAEVMRKYFRLVAPSVVRSRRSIRSITASRSSCGIFRNISLTAFVFNIIIRAKTRAIRTLLIYHDVGGTMNRPPRLRLCDLEVYLMLCLPAKEFSDDAPVRG